MVFLFVLLSLSLSLSSLPSTIKKKLVLTLHIPSNPTQSSSPFKALPALHTHLYPNQRGVSLSLSLLPLCEARLGKDHTVITTTIAPRSIAGA